MNCSEWKRIENALEEGVLSPELEAHLSVCRRCSGKLTAYRRFLRLYETEASSPQRGSVRAPQKPRALRLLAAASVMSVLLLTGALILPPRLEERDLLQDHARELAESVLEGGLFEYAQQFESGWESGWF